MLAELSEQFVDGIGVCFGSLGLARSFLRSAIRFKGRRRWSYRSSKDRRHLGWWSSRLRWSYRSLGWSRIEGGNPQRAVII
jgi:hypothetical protein